MFHATPHIQEHYSGNLESLARSVGLDWVFDHTNTPPQLVDYLDLLLDPVGVFLTMVPEGGFNFCPDINSGSWGLVFHGWAEVLDVIENDYKSPPGRRRAAFVALQTPDKAVTGRGRDGTILIHPLFWVL